MTAAHLTAFRSPPAKSALQHDYILLDGSGSMQNKWLDSLAAIEAYISGLRAAKIDSHCILQVFDSTDPCLIARDCPLRDWTSTLEPVLGAHWGTTPLYDAINILGRRLRDLDPPRCSIIIVTDGKESGSKYTSLVQAKAILDWMRAKSWQITFIGADFSNANEAALLGADRNSAIGVQQRLLADAARSLAAKRARYAATGDPMHFTESERQQFGGYLNGPST